MRQIHRWLGSVAIIGAMVALYLFLGEGNATLQKWVIGGVAAAAIFVMLGGFRDGEYGS